MGAFGLNHIDCDWLGLTYYQINDETAPDRYRSYYYYKFNSLDIGVHQYKITINCSSNEGSWNDSNCVYPASGNAEINVLASSKTVGYQIEVLERKFGLIVGVNIYNK